MCIFLVLPKSAIGHQNTENPWPRLCWCELPFSFPEIWAAETSAFSWGTIILTGPFALCYLKTPLSNWGFSHQVAALKESMHLPCDKKLVPMTECEHDRHSFQLSGNAFHLQWQANENNENCFLSLVQRKQSVPETGHVATRFLTFL